MLYGVYSLGVSERQPRLAEIHDPKLPLFLDEMLYLAGKTSDV